MHYPCLPLNRSRVLFNPESSASDSTSKGAHDQRLLLAEPRPCRPSRALVQHTTDLTPAPEQGGPLLSQELWQPKQTRRHHQGLLLAELAEQGGPKASPAAPLVPFSNTQQTRLWLLHTKAGLCSARSSDSTSPRGPHQGLLLAELAEQGVPNPGPADPFWPLSKSLQT